MRHYEIVFLVHPDQSEQVPAMLERYRGLIEGANGRVHREEDWGRLQLTHPIEKVYKAHYLMLNIECGREALDELVGVFRFNDAVIRYLVIKRDRAITEVSPMFLAKEEEKEREAAAEAAETERIRATAARAKVAADAEAIASSETSEEVSAEAPEEVDLSEVAAPVEDGEKVKDLESSRETGVEAAAEETEE